MVRVNLLNPKKLSDQHLIAEYNEILMLVAYIRKYTSLDNIPKNYCLGKGHMRFFKNKLLYLKKRHELLKKEIKKRGFVAKKSISLSKFKKELVKDWRASSDDRKIIKKRLIEKLSLKPEFYRYYSEYKSKKFFIELLR
jgi:deoxyribonuclease (pyrimidine dimer)